MAEVQRDTKKRLGLLESLRITFEGCRIITEIAPSYFPALLGVCFFTALQPIAVLFFSSRILNELAGTREVSAIAFYAGGAVLSTLLMTVVNAWLTRVVDGDRDSLAVPRINLLTAQRFAQMDYAYTEDSGLHEKLADMNTKMVGNGLGLLGCFYRTQPVAQHFFGLVFALLMLSGLFSSKAAYTPSFATSPWAALLLAGLMAAGLVLTALYQRKENGMLEEVFRENAKSNTSAWYYSKYLEADEAAKDIRLYGQQPALMRIFEQAFNTRAWFRFFRFMGRENGLSSAMQAAVSGGTYLLIGLRAMAGMYEIGDVLRYVGAIAALSAALGSLISDWAQLMNNAEYVKPLLDYLSMPPLIQKGTQAVPPLDGQDLVFEFRDVSFRYPGTQAFVLRHLTLTLRAGKRLAIVGPNGSGKTTLVKLLCRLYDPTEGEILLNGVDIKTYDYAQYHALFSVVFQDFKLFPLPLSQNVAVSGTPDTEKAERCLNDAGFGQRLKRMPEGVDSTLYKTFDEDGVQISGGEAQKIALARALYKNAPMVVLDEPTAALDPIAEFEVYSTFDKTIGGRTAIFISHRLSSCRFCDEIAVFENGCLMQHGGHAELLGDAQGLYATLWHAQAQHYVDEAGK